MTMRIVYLMILDGHKVGEEAYTERTLAQRLCSQNKAVPYQKYHDDIYDAEQAAIAVKAEAEAEAKVKIEAEAKARAEAKVEKARADAEAKAEADKIEKEKAEVEAKTNADADAEEKETPKKVRKYGKVKPKHKK